METKQKIHSSAQITEDGPPYKVHGSKMIKL